MICSYFVPMLLHKYQKIKGLHLLLIGSDLCLIALVPSIRTSRLTHLGLAEPEVKELCHIVGPRLQSSVSIIGIC